MSAPKPYPSPNHGPRQAPAVDMLVLHYTGMTDAKSALDRLRDPAAQVSAHYLIDEDGSVYALVDEGRRAWHAGVSAWRGETDVNSRSIGIELVNPGHEFGYRPFPDAQIKALIALGQGIVGRHPVPARNVVGHSDVAPARKLDPGELFPWARLAAEGLGLWPFDGGDGKGIEPARAAAALSEYGYDTSDLTASVMAFQRHFRAERVDGVMDLQSRGRLARLIEAVSASA